MWKLFLYNQWQYEKAEKFLCDMESSGYRLENIKCSYFFKFRQSSPRKVKYIFLYNFVKDYSSKHYDLEKYICNFYKGSRICGNKHFEPNVFRITDLDAELSTIFRFRNTYLKRVFKQKMFISSFFMLPTILLFTFGYSFDSRVIFLLFISVIALFCFLYNLLGLLSLSKK